MAAMNILAEDLAEMAEAAAHAALAEIEPVLSESLFRTGRWCQSTVCPNRPQAARQAAAAGDKPAADVPLIRLGFWCDSAACPLT
jgi:hypothetical protein